jgi:hypothetical protein
MLILDTFIGSDPSDQHTEYLLGTLEQAREQLAAAAAYLQRLSEDSLDLPGELATLLTAASDKVDPRTNRQWGADRTGSA